MITKQHGLQAEQLSIENSRPPIPKNWRKVLFFLLREGFLLTLRKIVLNYFNKKFYESSIVIAKINNNYDAISYDNGNSYYVSSINTQNIAWHNPFSYDVVAEMPGLEVSKNIPVNAVFCIGFGNYPRVYSLPQFPKTTYFCCVDYNDQILKHAKENFSLRCNDISQALESWQSADSPIAVICSYHSDHAKQAKLLFEANSTGYIFIEKPPVVNLDDIDYILKLYENKAKLDIGFNRRYAPSINKAKKYLSNGPKIITISVNEVIINQSHWYLWENQGTRITGNACHWIDLCQFFIDAMPESLTLSHSILTKDDTVININYTDGSLVTLCLSDKGNQLRGVQEYIEIREGNKTIKIEDFIKFSVYSDNATVVTRSLIRNKGHVEMYRYFYKNIKSNDFQTKYPVKDFLVVSLVTYHASQMLLNNINFYKFDWNSSNYKDYF